MIPVSYFLESHDDSLFHDRLSRPGESPPPVADK
jgi:hypothetical protein